MTDTRPLAHPASCSTREALERQEKRYPTLSYLFNAYLHQDWTIDGNSLPEIFRNSEGLQSLAPRIQADIGSLLAEGHDHECLDRLFFGRWQAGYEPDEDDGEDWLDVLEQISRICRTHTPAT